MQQSKQDKISNYYYRESERVLVGTEKRLRNQAIYEHLTNKQHKINQKLKYLRYEEIVKHNSHECNDYNLKPVKQQKKDEEQVLPVTIKQVLNAMKNCHRNHDIICKIDGKEVKYVQFVGIIISRKRAIANSQERVIISDGTGRVEIIFYINANEIEWNQLDSSTYSDNNNNNNNNNHTKRGGNSIYKNSYNYVEIIAEIQVYEHVPDIDTFWFIKGKYIRSISDFNEVTLHGLQVVFSHLFNTTENSKIIEYAKWNHAKAKKCKK